MLKAYKKIKRSPLFYVGDKYRLMKQILDLFPKEINNFYEPFVGGGTVFLNTKAEKYFLNDIEENLVNIHNLLVANAKTPGKFFDDVETIIHEYKLSHSCKKDVVPDSLKKKFKKTYYAKFNKKSYEKLRESVNNNEKNEPLVLYILLIYGFNRMLRFNGSGKFNLPVGNVDFNKNVVAALKDYFAFVENKQIQFTTKDFRQFFQADQCTKEDFIYFDPPYLLAASEYNKLWNENEETDLLELIDKLDEKGIKFGLSNVTHYNDGRNDLLIDWMKKYNVHTIKSNYINYRNNAQKNIKEIFITNY